MATYNLENEDANWFDSTAWLNATTGQYGQPGFGDVAIIQQGFPYLYDNYVDGPAIVLDNTTANAASGIALYNSVIGGDSPIYMEGSAGSTITLSNSVLYDPISVTGGANDLTASGGYGVTTGYVNVGNDQQTTTSLSVESGGYTNYGTMNVTAGGTLAFNFGKGEATNYGNIVANGGTVALGTVGEYGQNPGQMDDEGGILVANQGSMSVSTNLIVEQNAQFEVDTGIFQLGGTTGTATLPATGTLSGTGTLNLVSGTMEFLSQNAMNVASTLTTEFSGSNFTMQFDGATALSDLFQAAGPSGHDSLVVAAYFAATNQVQQMSFSLDTAHAYAASDFTTQGNHLTFAAATSTHA